jgi:PAS domain S-box-containing protein
MTSPASPKPIALDEQARWLLRDLPVGVYATDLAGRITFYNEAAATLWGHRPEPGDSEFVGAAKHIRPDGTPIPFEEWPSAIALSEKRTVAATAVIAERADGARFTFLSSSAPQFDQSGTLTGAVTTMVVTGADADEELSGEYYAALVESSDDAILSKNLDGVITSWNRGAQQVFGYTADEAIGQLVTMLIPPERHDEEPSILARIRRGERIDHYETIRQRKDGSLIDISLTVSPIKDVYGRIVGASKIARDITERNRSQQQLRLLLREMDHRVRNLFAISSGLVMLSARSASTPDELATKVRERLAALGRAHGLLLAKAFAEEAGAEMSMTLHALIRTILSPYDTPANGVASRVTIEGPDPSLLSGAVTGIALLLHEFATNAAKYGALSTPTGTVEIVCLEEDGAIVLVWTERGGPRIEHRGETEGFGSLLVRTTVKGQFNGSISQVWAPEGLTIRLSIERDRLAG